MLRIEAFALNEIWLTLSVLIHGRRAVAEVLALPEACFSWPADLPVPRVVLLLVMPHDADRMARLRARGAADWGPTEVRRYSIKTMYEHKYSKMYKHKEYV